MMKKIKQKLKIRKVKKTERALRKALKKEAVSIAKNGKKTAYDNGVVTWKAPEYTSHRKGWLWYSIFVLIFVASSYLAFIYGSWSFALALTVFAVVYLFSDKKKPKKVSIKLSEIGVKVGTRVYQYSRIRAFWVVYNPPFQKTLHLEVYNELVSEVEIPLPEEDPTEIYQFLAQRIPELEGKEPGFLDNLSKLLKL
jgi:hypothetical protein